MKLEARFICFPSSKSSARFTFLRGMLSIHSFQTLTFIHNVYCYLFIPFLKCSDIYIGFVELRSFITYTVKFSLIDGLYNKCNRQAVWVSFPQKKNRFNLTLQLIYLWYSKCKKVFKSQLFNPLWGALPNIKKN